MEAVFFLRCEDAVLLTIDFLLFCHAELAC